MFTSPTMRRRIGNTTSPDGLSLTRLPSAARHTKGSQTPTEKGMIMPQQPPQWQKTVSSTKDPLVSYIGKPVISDAGPNQKYIGRVIVELWELVPQNGQTTPVVVNDVDGIAVSTDATASGGHHAELLDRVVAALPQRVANDKLVKQG